MLFVIYRRCHGLCSHKLLCKHHRFWGRVPQSVGCKRKGGLHSNKAHRISREMIQFNRYIVYQADSAHGSQFPDLSYRQYPTSNPHASIYVFDLVAIQEIINNLLISNSEIDTEYARLIEDFRKAGMKPVEKDGIASVVRGKCALELAMEIMS